MSKRPAEEQPTQQGKIELQVKRRKEQKQLTEFEHFIESVESKPELWKDDRLTFLRQFVNFIIENRDKFPDRVTDVPPARDGHAGLRALTKGFIDSIVKNKCTEAAPVVQVVSKSTNRAKGYGQDPTFKLVKMRIVDGDGNVMGIRLDTNATNYARRIGEGDVLLLDMYTSLATKVNDSSPLMPIALVLKFTHLGHKSLPQEMKEPIAMEASSADEDDDDSNVPLDADDIECNERTRLCSLYGVEFNICVCKCMPPEDIDIAEAAEDCHFVTRDASRFDNKDRRFVLYWYYATNIYSIRGKGNRKHLPICLVKRIRELHPEASGNYTGYKAATTDYVASLEVDVTGNDADDGNA